MGCPAEVTLGDTFVFSVCTHDPDTGALTDADAVPSYRVYEDETATAILTGNMAKLDDSNTLGFYTETITASVGNGFEANKTYTVYIVATVDSDTGGIAYGIKCAANVWDYATRTLTATAAATTAAVSGSDLAITIAATYTATLSGMTIPATWTKVWFTLKNRDNHTDAQSQVQILKSNPASAANDGLLYLAGAVATTKANGSLVVDQAAGTVAITITDDATVSLSPGTALVYDLKVMTSAGATTVLTEGTATISYTPTRAIT